MKEIWIVEEFTCYDDGRKDERTAEGFYTTKEQALAAIHADLADTLEEEDMSAPNVTRVDVDDDYITIHVNCGDAYGMYNWYYVVSAEDINLDFHEYR